MQGSMVEWKSSCPRNSHDQFLIEDRDWISVGKLWSSLLKLKNLPPFFAGDELYGITRLNQLKFDREKEFASNNPKSGRKTFAFVLGYDGSQYSGYQQQKGSNVKTVEDDLDLMFGRKLIASGRTDKDVSALSQVVCFSTFENDTNSETIMEKVLSSDPITNHHIAVWECQRVPRKFHPIFSATWRRYIYVFPIKVGAYDVDGKMCDIDVAFVNRSLSRLVNRNLPYNGFAHRDDRSGGEGLQDFCVMFRARAELMDLTDFEELNEMNGNSNQATSSMAVSIELVGSRFLRRMVRILVATVLRESTLPPHERDEDILLKIALTRDRGHAAYAVPGVGLALCGVGYDLEGDAHKDVMIPVEPEFQAIIDHYQLFESQKHQSRRDEESDQENTNKSKNRGSESQEIEDNQNEVKDDGEEEEDGVGGKMKRKQLSRRERYQKKMKRNQISELETIAATTTDTKPTQLSNTMNIQSFLSNGNITSFQTFSSCTFENELMCKDGDLLYFPQRSFHFNNSDRDIILSQSYCQVSSTIWDAEVVLAHFIDQFDFHHQDHLAIMDQKRPVLVELGAGVGLAGMLASLKKNYFSKLILQEMNEEIIQYTKERIEEFSSSTPPSSSCPSSSLTDVSPLIPVSCLWGEEGSNIIQRLIDPSVERIEWIVMADVLYHQEDFQSLLETIQQLLNDSVGIGNVLLAFEQRRKDVNPFLLELRHHFQSCHVSEYCINNSHHNSETRIYLCYFQLYHLQSR